MSFYKNYSIVERLLHHLAFSLPVVHKILCELENDIYKKQIAIVNSKREVFVTGLPRAGTTLILELLYETKEFNTFSYRHMPFILAPLLWRKISKPFAIEGSKIERAHGDGMEISFDSPEAFEEVIWLSYLKDKFVKIDKLSTLSPSDITKEFLEIFKSSIKKLLLEASDEYPSTIRYLSKNNANCSRIEAISDMFPSATILIPFRQPLAHVGSLMKQHSQFTDFHTEDKFSKRYMKWIGHYDFGENFRPINFDNWLDSNSFNKMHTGKNFWLKYWTAAYNYMLSHKTNNVRFVDFDKLLSDSENSLLAIADNLVLTDKESFIKQANKLRSPTSKPVESQEILLDNLEAAESVYGRLKSEAL